MGGIPPGPQDSDPSLRSAFRQEAPASHPSTRKPRVLGTPASLTPPGRLKLAGPLAARAPGLRLGLAFALEIERHGSADKVLQGRRIDLVAFVDVDGPPDIPLQAGVE